MATCGAETLRATSFEPSIYTTKAEYYASVWLNNPHIGKSDTVLNRSERIISCYVKSTTIFRLPVLGHTEPHRNTILLREYTKASHNLSLPLNRDLVDFGRFKSQKSPRPPGEQPNICLEESYNGLDTSKIEERLGKTGTRFLASVT